MSVKDGFSPLLCFPDINKTYQDKKLFPIFSSRLPDKKEKIFRLSCRNMA